MHFMLSTMNIKETNHYHAALCFSYNKICSFRFKEKPTVATSTTVSQLQQEQNMIRRVKFMKQVSSTTASENLSEKNVT